MSSYKHLVQNNTNMVNRLAKGAGIRTDLAQGILWFVRCLVKPGMVYVDQQIFSVVMTTYMGISDQNSITKVYDRLTKFAKVLSVEQFASVLCLFYSDSIDMKIEYVFKLFDRNCDMTIDIGEVSTLVRSCRCVTDTDETEKDETFADLLNMVFDILKISHHSGITLERFRETVKKNRLVLAMLGQNLPSQQYLDSFKSKILGKTSLQMKEAFGNVRSDLLFEPPDTSKPKFYPIELDLP